MESKAIIIPLFLMIAIQCGLLPEAVPADDTADRPSVETQSDAVDHSPIGLFRKFISPADGDRCPMYPTCSHYAQQAVAQKGILMGWILTCDRLLRCGRDETRTAPQIRIQDTKYTYDPLDANTFWWKSR